MPEEAKSLWMSICYIHISLPNNKSELVRSLLANHLNKSQVTKTLGKRKTEPSSSSVSRERDITNTQEESLTEF